jgi:hypothetical protein
MERRTQGILAVVLVACAASAAFGQSVSEPSDAQVSERLAYIEGALASGRAPARAWWYGWIAAYGAGTVAQWSLAGAHWKDTKPDTASPDGRVKDRAFAEDMLVGGGTTALGCVALLIDPFTPASAPRSLGRLPASTPEERRAKLLRAEELLRRCAERERKGRSLTTHLLNLGVNALAGVVTVVAFDRPVSDGLMTFAAGEAVSLLNIFTQPRRAVRDLREYEAMVRGGSVARTTAAPGRDVYLALTPRGISLSFRF